MLGHRMGAKGEAQGFHGSGLWAVILGGSSGFGLATARRLSRAGLSIAIGHKDRPAVVETELKPHFEFIRSQGVELLTHNGNLSEDEERGALMDAIERRAGRGRVHLFLHSIAAGSCRVVVDAPLASRRHEALDGLAAALSEQGVTVPPETLRRAVNAAFHEKGCDALYTLAESRIPYPESLLSDEDLARTIALMGYDYLLWSRELLARGLLARGARLVALTSQGSTIAWRGYAAVSAAKAALEAVCRALAVELGPHGARACVVQAGITDTPAGNAIPNFDLMKAQARLRNPSGRLTTTEDVAGAIHGLCLPFFDWANGSIIRVDGGEAIAGSET
jgi:NAD(P)-dependent dehydrogenase (short-subunit alcohol dehydrogenase family)